MKLLIIDNYDSFTFNLKHICEPYVSFVDVLRNDCINIPNLIKYDKIIISPGPGLPKNAGCTIDVIKYYADKIPILGICLGAQAIAVSYGLDLYNLQKVMHGKKSDVRILDKNDIIYRDINHTLTVGRYHSWAIAINQENQFKITAVDQENTVMSFTHKVYPLIGIQYHPESILTNYGNMILKNWITS